MVFTVEGAGNFGGTGILFAGALDLTGDNQRCTSFIHQNGVNLVDDAEVEEALYHIGDGGGHVVAQVVEAELAVGTVGDVAAVVLATFSRRHALLNQPHAEAQEAMNLPHPFGIAAGQIVIHRNDVNSLAGQWRSGKRAGWLPGFYLPRFSFRQSGRRGGPCRQSAARRKWRMPSTRFEASRTTAKASGSRSSKDSPWSIRCLNSVVLPDSCFVERAFLNLFFEQINLYDIGTISS
jgi:hypothetical protein